MSHQENEDDVLDKDVSCGNIGFDLRTKGSLCLVCSWLLCDSSLALMLSFDWQLLLL